MNLFTIKDVENLTGIKAHSWRIWENRYNLGIAQRKESLHRFYDDKDLKNLLRIAYLYHSGIKISRIGKLSENEMIKAAEKITSTDKAAIFYLKELLEASIDLDTYKFKSTLETIADRMGIHEAMITVVYPFLERLGFLWLTNHLIPGQEHLSSNLIVHKLLKAIEDLPFVSADTAPVYILFSPENEHHEIPLLFIHYLLKKHNKKVVYFGSNTAISEINTYAENKPFNYIIFHVITNLTRLNPDNYVSQLVELFPSKQIVVSGPFANTLTISAQNLRLLRSLDDMLAFTRE